jgi:hypothetical protein
VARVSVPEVSAANGFGRVAKNPLDFRLFLYSLELFVTFSFKRKSKATKSADADTFWVKPKSIEIKSICCLYFLLRAKESKVSAAS